MFKALSLNFLRNSINEILKFKSFFYDAKLRNNKAGIVKESESFELKMALINSLSNFT